MIIFVGSVRDSFGMFVIYGSCARCVRGCKCHVVGTEKHVMGASVDSCSHVLTRGKSEDIQ